MKNINNKKNITHLIFAGLICYIPVEVNATKPPPSKVETIRQLEGAGQLSEALSLTVQEALHIYKKVGIGEVVREVNSSILRIDEEIKVQTHRSSSEASILGIFKVRTTQSYDVTKILTTNPQSLQRASEKAYKDFVDLQNYLYKYLEQNERALFQAKVLTAKSLSLVAKMPGGEREIYVPLVESLFSKMTHLFVSGTHRVTSCITTHYAKRSKSNSAFVSFLFGEGSFESSSLHHAYSETLCEAKKTSLYAFEESLFSVSLNWADAMMQFFAKELALQRVLDADKPFYPTWGSPHFEP